MITGVRQIRHSLIIENMDCLLTECSRYIGYYVH